MNKLIALLVLGFALAPQAQASTLYGVEATKRQNSTIPYLTSQGSASGNVKVCYDSYTMTADLAPADVIYMCLIPAGAKVLDVRLTNSALSAGSLNVGYLSSADAVETGSSTAFLSAVAATSAATYSAFEDNGSAAGLKSFSSQVQVAVRNSVDTTASSGTIAVQVWYIVE